MRTKELCFIFSVLLAGSLGCRSVQVLGCEALRATTRSGTAAAHCYKSARIVKMLKTYHDKGNLDERDVAAVLFDFGLIGTRPAHLPRSRKPKRSAKTFPVPVYKGDWMWPLKAGVVSSEFGPRWKKQHRGLDIAAKQGTPIYASADGEVVYAGDQLTGYGNVVILQHDRKTTTLYAHNKRNKVKVGQKVERGSVIALLGSTGRSTGPHVHYEIRGSKGPVNPRKILPKSRF
jgi:murein DD-endopeptidase MepM/ murein hydrolase activator NlpD